MGLDSPVVSLAHSVHIMKSSLSLLALATVVVAFASPSHADDIMSDMVLAAKPKDYPKRRTECGQTRYPDPKTSPVHETGASPQ